MRIIKPIVSLDRFQNSLEKNDKVKGKKVTKAAEAKAGKTFRGAGKEPTAEEGREDQSKDTQKTVPPMKGASAKPTVILTPPVNTGGMVIVMHVLQKVPEKATIVLRCNRDVQSD
jgi:hypothetical protein